MKISRSRLPISLALSGLFCLQACNTASEKPSSSENGLKGMVFLEDGKPAAGALVKFFDVDQIPTHYLIQKAGSSQPVAIAKTNVRGEYQIDSLPPGQYNVFSGLDGLGCLRYSLVLTKNELILPSDTLRATNKTQAVIILEPQHDPKTVAVLVLGSDITSQANGNGEYTLQNIPMGKYRVRLVSTIKEYLPLEFDLKVENESHPTDSLILPYTGIPVVRGIQVKFDTTSGIVSVSWKKSNSAQLSSYQISRHSLPSNPELSFGFDREELVKDTIFSDSLSQDIAGFDEDVEGIKLAYSVKIINRIGDLGPSVEPIPVSVVGKARIRSLIGLNAWVPVAGTPTLKALAVARDATLGGWGQLPEILGIGDTAKIIASYANLGRHIRNVTWSDGSGKKLQEKNVNALNGTDTLVYSRSTPGSDQFRISATDDAGQKSEWDFTLNTISDPPKSNAGADRDVFVGDTLTLVVKATDRTGVIAKLEWDIGSTGVFKTTDDGRIHFIAPNEFSNAYPCILKATDNRGETDLDTLILKIGHNKMLAPMKVARGHHSLEAVNGKIYAIGSDAEHLENTEILEEYDPISNSWKTKAPVPIPRLSALTVSLNGKIYLVGGKRVEFDSESNKHQTLEPTTVVNTYDPATDMWGSVTAMPGSGLVEVYATMAHANRLYVIGMGGSQQLFFEYYPADDSWHSLPLPEIIPESMLSVEGQIYLVRSLNGTLEMFEYNLATNTIIPKKTLKSRGSTIKATSLGGKIYVIGGVSTEFHSNSCADWNEGYPSFTIDIYDPTVNKWTLGGEVITARKYNALTVLGNEIFINGGTLCAQFSMEKYRP